MSFTYCMRLSTSTAYQIDALFYTSHKDTLINIVRERAARDKKSPRAHQIQMSSI